MGCIIYVAKKALISYAVTAYAKSKFLHEAVHFFLKRDDCDCFDCQFGVAAVPFKWLKFK